MLIRAAIYLFAFIYTNRVNSSIQYITTFFATNTLKENLNITGNIIKKIL